MPRFTGWRFDGPLVGILVLAAVVRIGVLAVQPHPDAVVGLTEPAGEIARNIVVHGKWFDVNLNAPFNRLPGRGPQWPVGPLVDPADANYAYADNHPQFVPLSVEQPGESLLLAGLWFAFGNFRYIDVQLLQILVDLGVCYIIYLLGMELFKIRRAALTAAAIYAVALPVAFRLTLPLYDVWAGFYGPVVTYLVIRSARSRHPWRWYFLIAALTGIAVWFRAYLVLIPVAIGVYFLMRKQWRRGVAITAASLAGAVLLITPLTVWNAQVYHRFIPANLGFGAVLYQTFVGQDDNVTFRQVHAVAPSLQYATPEYDALLFHWAIRDISNNKVEFLREMATRLANETFLLHDSPKNFDLVRPQLVRFPLTAWLLMDPFVVALACVGVATTWRHRKREHLMLATILAAGLVVPTITQSEYRYMAPIYFVYVLWAALGLLWIGGRLPTALKRHRSHRAQPVESDA